MIDKLYPLRGGTVAARQRLQYRAQRRGGPGTGRDTHRRWCAISADLLDRTPVRLFMLVFTTIWLTSSRKLA